MRKRSAEALNTQQTRPRTSSRQRAGVSESPASPAPGAQSATRAGNRGQSEWFDKAVALFHARKLEQAREFFERAAEGPAPEMVHAARAYIRMCEQRLNPAEPQPTTADEHYAYGIALLNQRRLEEAERHLTEAARMAPAADHVYYALALCRGLQGDYQGAGAQLRRAIELQPQTRFLARRDPDFSGLVHEPAIKEILWPEGS